MLISTVGFLKTISTVSGKDINVFVDQWICKTGVAKFNVSFSFNRKRNIIELEMTQYSGNGCQKYVGPFNVCVQELDGSFSHTVQVEDTVSNHEIPCHSKSRRNKKKKIPLVTGEEVDMDLSATFDTDSPVLWVRVDPDLTWARRVILEQPDYMWQYQLRYERDVTSQIEAVRSLEKYPCSGTRNALIDIINQNEAFYRVRQESTYCLAKVLAMDTEMVEEHNEIMEIYEKMFGSKACSTIPKYNNFSNFIAYFLQKTLPLALSHQRRKNEQCSKRIIKYIMDLIKYNDNRFNSFSDGAYLASLIDALGNSLGPAEQAADSVEPSARSSLPINEEARAILSEVNRKLNMEKILPSYKYAITCSCLKALRKLQVHKHIPAESAFFRKYSQYGLFDEIRMTALEMLVDFVSVHTSEKDMEWLLDLVEKDPVPRIKHHIISCFIAKPPFEKKSSASSFNNLQLVERLWQLMNCESVNDYRLRCSLMELYKVFWGQVTPHCVPSHGFGVVIDLKEKKAMSNIGTPKAPASPELNASVSAGEESFSGKKRRISVEASSFVDHSIMDSMPGTPMSMCSENSNKIKLKIKLAGEETSHDSGSDFLPPMKSNDPLSLFDEDTNTSTKKMKKKKKKKHKHKDKNKEKEKNLLDFSNTQIPGVSRNHLDDRLAANSPLGTLSDENDMHGSLNAEVLKDDTDFSDL